MYSTYKVPGKNLRIPWSQYIPHTPTPKQLAFLLLPHEEAFYGGAAGGGKSDALLMAALQYVDLPNYSALVFRRSLQEAEMRSSVIWRANEWLAEWEVHPDPQQRTRWDNKNARYVFPSGATVQFAYVGEGTTAASRIASSEYQFIAFDELAHFTEKEYLFPFSRLRKNACQYHGIYPKCYPLLYPARRDPITKQYHLFGEPYDESQAATQHPKAGEDHPLAGEAVYISGCIHCGLASMIPLRVRAASNPPRAGEKGSGATNNLGWILKRFDIRLKHNVYDPGLANPVKGKADPKAYRSMYVGQNPTRPHIPAFLYDNPYINQKDYRRSLGHLDPITEAQLAEGDWGVREEGRFKKEHSVYYHRDRRGSSDYITLKHRTGQFQIFRYHEIQIFQTIDPAASAREGPGDNVIYKDHIAPSRSVISTWAITPGNHLMLLECEYFTVEIPYLIERIQASFRRHRPNFIAIEANGLGIGVFQSCMSLGLPVQNVSHSSQDKLTRATDIQLFFKYGKVFLPEDGIGYGTFDWLRDPDGVENELYGWTGHPHQANDIIDTFSYAGIILAEHGAMAEMFGSSSAIPMHVQESKPFIPIGGNVDNVF